MMVTSCTQYDNNAERDLNVKSSEHNKFDRILSDEEINMIGVNHNLTLNDLYSSNPQNITDVHQRTLVLFQESGIDIETLENYQEKPSSLNTEYLADLILQASSDFVNSELLNQKLFEIKDINNTIDLLNHRASTRSELIGVDLDTYLVVSTVYEHSMDFWTAKFPDEPITAVNDWKEADGISAAIGFFTLAAAFAAISAIGAATGGTGIIPTIGIVAGLLEIGAQAALASIYEAFK